MPPCLQPWDFYMNFSFQSSCSLSFSFTLFLCCSFDHLLFPLCLLGSRAWLLGNGLPFKCCFCCSTVTDHWPETGVAMEASTLCTIHTFPNDAHWKGDFLPVWNNKPAWHIKLSWYECSKIEPLRPGFVCKVRWGNSHV